MGTKYLFYFTNVVLKSTGFIEILQSVSSFWGGKCVRRNNHIKSTRSRCERRRVVCLHWTLKKDIGNFHFVTIKYFRKSAENYLFVIDTMIDQKYLSQIGQKMCNFA